MGHVTRRRKRLTAMLALAMSATLGTQIFGTYMAPSVASPVVDDGTTDVIVDDDSQGGAGTSYVAQPVENVETDRDRTQSDQVTPTASSRAAGINGCSYADPGSGAYAQTLCWFDFTGFTTEYLDRGAGTSPRYVSVLDPTNGPFNYTVAGSHSTLPTGTTRLWGHIQNYPVSIDLGDGYVLTATLSTSATVGQPNRGRRDQ